MNLVKRFHNYVMIAILRIDKLLTIGKPNDTWICLPNNVIQVMVELQKISSKGNSDKIVYQAIRSKIRELERYNNKELLEEWKKEKNVINLL